MKKIIFLTIACTLALYWYSCQKLDDVYIDPKAPAPAQVANLNVKNTPGGAVLSYKIPKDPNLLYVKAVYEIQKGVYRVAKSSYYVDTLPLVGFGDTLIHEVKIYSVGRNEKESEPLTVQVKPLTPPVKSVFAMITLEEAFGGLRVIFQNPTQAEIAIHIIADTTGQNTWSTINTFYTAAVDGDFSVRGLDTIELKFGLYVTDHWGNISDTLMKVLTPLYEMEIPKSGFKNLKLPGDFWQNISGQVQSRPLESLWDGRLSNIDELFNSANQSVMPQWFTIDLGVKSRLSRMKLYQWWPAQRMYASYWLKTFEIWGSNTPNPDGSWDASWELLGHFVNGAPSGLPWPQWNADDQAYEMNGADHTFPQPIPAVRYIRFKAIDTFGGAAAVAFSEITMFGQPIP